MEIRRMRLTELTPASYNPRKDLTLDDPEYQKLRRSLQEFGYVEPIIYNETTHRIVSGHQRLKVLLDLGIAEEDVVIIQADDRDEKILNILLNRTKGRWDNEKLAVLIQELNDAGSVDLTGFDEWELQGILANYQHLEDILDYSPPASQDEEKNADPEGELFSMTFQIPIEYKDDIDLFLDSVPEAEAELEEAVIQLVKGA